MGRVTKQETCTGIPRSININRISNNWKQLIKINKHVTLKYRRIWPFSHLNLELETSALYRSEMCNVQFVCLLSRVQKSNRVYEVTCIQDYSIYLYTLCLPV